MKRVVLDQSQRVGEWVCERTGGIYESKTSSAIGLERDGELIAGVLFDHFNGSSCCMHIALSNAYAMTRGMFQACFTYAFKHCKLHKVIGLVDEANSAARKFDEHLGFVLEARITGAAKGGDLLLYTMTPKQCRFLG